MIGVVVIVVVVVVGGGDGGGGNCGSCCCRCSLPSLVVVLIFSLPFSGPFFV